MIFLRDFGAIDDKLITWGVTMAATRRSIAQEVVGLPPSDALLLDAHDEEFYAAGITRADAADLGDDSDDASDVSDSEPEQPLGSEDEEDLDAAEQTGGETVSAAAAADTSAGQRKKRNTFHNTTLEEVAARCTQGCSCSNKNCFTSLSQADLLAYRNLTEKIEIR